MPEISAVIAPAEGGVATLQMVDGLTYDKNKSTLAYARKVSYAIARQLRQDPTVKLARLLAVAPVLAQEWTVEATPEAPEGAEQHIVDTILKHRQSLVKAALFSLIDYGWCGLEVVWALNESSQYYVKSLTNLLVDITTIKIDPTTGDFIGFVQAFKDSTGKDTTAEISGIAKTLLYNQNQEGSNFYGQGDLDSVLPIQERYDRVQEICDAFDRKTAGATWIVRYPVGRTLYNGASTDNYEIARTLLSSIKSNGGLCIPTSVASALGPATGSQPFNKLITANDWEVELKESQGTTSAHLLNRSQYLDTLKVRALGLPERAILEGKHGTKAEAEAHADVALTVAADRGDYILQQLNEGPVNVDIELNYGPQYKGTVRIISSPIGADEKLFLRECYKGILSNPTLSMLDFDSIDMAAVRDLVGIPSKDASELGTPLDALRSALGNGGTPAGTIQNADLTTDPTAAGNVA